jgi:hypothetical protein
MILRGNPFEDVNQPDMFGDRTPRFTPQISEDILGKIGDGLLGGLATIGGILDKPGRAIRGVLNTVTGGDPASLREILAILPLSDSLGITNINDRVSGQDLLSNVGAITSKSSQAFDENDLAGIGAEILTDPLSFLGVGTLTRAGKAVQKAGGQTRVGFQARRLGADLAESDINKILGARGGALKPRDLATPVENVIPASVTGVTPRSRLFEESKALQDLPVMANQALPSTMIPKTFSELEGLVRTGYDLPTGLKFSTLDGFVGGLPKTRTIETLLDQAGSKVARLSENQVIKEATNAADALGSTLTLGKLPLGIDRLLGMEPIRINSRFLDRNIDDVVGAIQAGAAGRQFSRMFDSRVGNARTKEVQEVQRDVGAINREKYLSDYLGQFQDLKQKSLGGFAPIINPVNEQEAMRFLREGVELSEYGGMVQAQTGVKYGRPKTFAEYEKQLASRPANDPAAFANRLDEMTADGSIAEMQSSFSGLSSLVDDVDSFMKTIRKGEVETGMKSSDLFDMIEYLPRDKMPLVRKPGEGFMAYANRALQESLKTTTPNNIARKKILTDIPGGTSQIEDWVANPALRSMNVTQRKQFFFDELTGGVPPASPARMAELRDQANGLARWVEGLGDYGTKVDGKVQSLFDSNVFNSIERRMTGSATAKSATDAVIETIRRFGITNAQARASGVSATPALLTLKESNISGQGAGLLKRDLRDLGAGLQDIVVPNEIHNDLVKIQKAWTQPEEMRPLLKAWDSLLQTFKGAVTYPFPAFHFRNGVSGVYNMWRDGITPSEIVNSGRDAFKLLTRSGPVAGMNRDDLVRELVQGRTAFTKAGRQVAEDTGNLVDALPGRLRGEGAIENLVGGFKAAGKAGKDEWPVLGWVVRQGKAAGNFMEDWLRTTHYLAKKGQGFDLKSASESVRKYQLDYTRLTEFERNTVKRLIPWWSFSRNNLPPLLEEVVQNPAKLATSIRASTYRDRGTFVPQYMSEGVAIPLGQQQPGFDRYIASLGLPFEDELVKTLGNVAAGRYQRATQQLLGTMTPWIKFPLENAFGTQLHSGRKLEDLVPNEVAKQAGALAEGAGLGQLDAGFFNQAFGLTPLTRFFTAIGNAADERKDTLAKAGNLLSGTWVTDIDATKLRNIAVRDILQDMLRGDPAVTNWQKFYVKPDQFQQLEPSQQMIYTLYKSLEDRAREEARKRADALQTPR